MAAIPLAHLPGAPPAQRLTLSLLDGTRIVIRPIRPEDKPVIADGFDHLSEESRHRRFMGGPKRLTSGMLTALTEIDYHDHFAWVAYAPDAPGSPGVAVARYVRLRDEPFAEPAITVVDEFQRRGLGTLMLDVLARTAVANGIKGFRAFVLVDNRPMIRILRRFGANLSVEEPGVLRADIDLDI